jgi:hypothetical protein
MLVMFSLMHAWFVEQLSNKVLRAMKDAFLKGKNIRPPAVGHKLVPVLDADGLPLFNSKGRIISKKVIDEAIAPFVEEAFVHFVEEKWSPMKIARRFCDLRVKGRDTWDAPGIMKMLTRTTYIGMLTTVENGGAGPAARGSCACCITSMN